MGFRLIRDGDILMTSGISSDVEGLCRAVESGKSDDPKFKDPEGDESLVWCPILAMDWMVGHPEITFFDWSKNAVTHVATVSHWKHVYKMVYSLEIDDLNELADVIPAPADLDARINQACSGDPCRISTIYGAELRVFPYSMFEALGEEAQEEAFDTMAEEVTRPQHAAFRSHPDWAESLRYLAKHPHYSSFYDGCAEDLVEVGIAQGFITPADIEDARRRKARETR